MYQAISHLRQTCEKGFNMYPAILNHSTILAVFSDSSWANSVDFASQHGCVILMTSPRVTEQICSGLILDWKSSRSPRIRRSTLAAEASAADVSVDRAVFLNHMVCELFDRRPAYKLQRLLRLLHITDCRSLYDCLNSENPNAEEKRTIISIRSAQQAVARENSHWVPTNLIFADGLTKLDKKLMESLLGWLQKPWIQWRCDPKDIKAKQERSV